MNLNVGEKVPFHFFGCTSRLQLVVLVSAFVVVGGQYGLFSFLFAVLLLMVRHAQPLAKVGCTCPVPHGINATGGSKTKFTSLELIFILFKFPFCQLLGLLK